MSRLFRFIMGTFIFVVFSCRENPGKDTDVAKMQKAESKTAQAASNSLNNKAIAAWHNGNYQKALQYIKASVENARQKGDEKEMAQALNNQGLVNWSLENSETALECYEEAGRIAERLGLSKLLGLTHTNRGLVYKARGDYKKALEHNNEAIRIFTKHQNYRELAIALNNQGQIYKRQRQNDIAKSFYLKALFNYNKENYKDGIAATYYNLADIHMQQGSKAEALKSINESLRISTDVQNHVQINDAYQKLAEIYEHFGENDSALKYYKVYTSLNTKQLIANQSDKLAAYQAELGAEVKNLRIINLQKEQQLSQSRLWFIGILIISVLLILLFILYRYFMKIRYRKRSLEIELDSSKNIISIKEQELKNYILDLSDKNRTINKMQEQLIQYTTTSPEDSNRFQQLLEQKILTDEDWVIFKEKFKNIYPMFFTRIKQAKMLLSEAEIRIIMLLCLNLTGKEMAATLGISDQSARVGKLRLKKKLQTEGYQTISEFIPLLIK